MPDFNSPKNPLPDLMPLEEDRSTEVSSQELSAIRASLMETSWRTEQIVDVLERNNILLERDLEKITNLKRRLRGSQDDKRAASWKWAKNYYFRLSAFHRKAGVAASNVKHWGARAYVKKKILEVHGIKLPGLHEFSAEENKLFQNYRRLYFHKNLKLMFNFIKDEVARKYPV